MHPPILTLLYWQAWQSNAMLWQYWVLPSQHQLPPLQQQRDAQTTVHQPMPCMEPCPHHASAASIYPAISNLTTEQHRAAQHSVNLPARKGTLLRSLRS
jgi:hypothetical protein